MAAHVLGSGILIYGDGPDGAREASYEGTLDFPTPTDKWTGYTVMQAKFRQVPGTPSEDADWLVRQLKEEFKKFEPPSSLRKPDYYILVTNACLSPSPPTKRSKGGIDKINDVFKHYSSTLGLKGYQVWHRDKLSTLLMNAPNLRRTFQAWLLTSDLIADMLDHMHARGHEVRCAMYRYLARELRAQQPVRLQQAGHSGDAQTMIEDVFTDLPFNISGEHEYELSDDLSREREYELSGQLLNFLLNRSRDQLDYESVRAQHGKRGLRPERILLLGGPGQGKSTATQFLAQLLRASILQSDKPGEYSAETEKIIDSSLTKAADIGINTDVPKRFPLRVDLPSFADALTKTDGDRPRSLLEYLSQHISAIAQASVSTEDVRSWIAVYPAVVILDGLDEVPPSANRDTVIRAISDLWDEAPTADLLMIVTTRPQGYNDDLDPTLYAKLEMTALSPEQAVNYAQRLATARIHDSSHCARVIARLTEAANSKTTVRLMISPLQVSILLALIDQRGDAPTNRWSLFDTYFDTVLKREQSKTGPVGEAMRHWGRQITSLHYKAGFLLHVEAEMQGSSESYLTAAEFAELIKCQLEDEGFEDEELRRASHDLNAASTERLVLIVQREEDRFSFEVRSLQEFAAAAYIMAGREIKVQDRLRSIANRSHWLHVFQIAASKCFAITDSEQYRDTVITICQDVNENGDEIDRLLHTGSTLALALLDDGLAYDAPKYRRLLLKIAFDILLSGSGPLPTTLSDHCAQEPERTIRLLRHFLNMVAHDPVEAAWKLMMQCSEKGQDWVEPILDEFWPTDLNALSNLFTLQVEPQAGSRLCGRLSRVLENVKAGQLDQIVTQLHKEGSRFPLTSLVYPCMEFLNVKAHGEKINFIIDGIKTPLVMHYIPVSISSEQRSAYNNIPDTPGWASLRALINCHEKLDTIALADFLEKIEKEDWAHQFRQFISVMPWPIATLLEQHYAGTSLIDMAAAVRAGAYGNRDDWTKAEKRWESQGITENDFTIWETGKFFDNRVAEIGAPRMTATFFISGPSDLKWYSSLMRSGMRSAGAPRDLLRQLIVFFLTVLGQKVSTNEEALFLLENEKSLEQLIDPRLIMHLSKTLLEEPLLLEKLDEIGRLGRYFLHSTNPFVSNDSIIKHAFIVEKAATYLGLVVPIANILSSDTWHSPSEIFSEDTLTKLKIAPESILSGYGIVLSVISGFDDPKTVREILQRRQEPHNASPLRLLSHFLNQKNLPRPLGLAICEALAGAINRNPKLPHKYLMTQMRTFANSRAASLHNPERWKELELGERLQKQVKRRRAD